MSVRAERSLAANRWLQACERISALQQMQEYHDLEPDVFAPRNCKSFGWETSVHSFWGGKPDPPAVPGDLRSDLRGKPCCILQVRWLQVILDVGRRWNARAWMSLGIAVSRSWGGFNCFVDDPSSSQPENRGMRTRVARFVRVPRSWSFSVVNTSPFFDPPVAYREETVGPFREALRNAQPGWSPAPALIYIYI